MRIGVSLPESPPDIGGGWTIEADLLQALFGQTSKSNHEFIFFGTPATPSLSLPPGFEYVSLNPSRPIYRRMMGRFTRILKKSVGSIGQFLEVSKLKNENNVSILNSHHRIQFLLTMAPRAFSMEVPFLLFVWDIEFLFQPYFPELSNNGEWNARFDYYQRVLRRATFIVTSTEICKSQIINHFQISAERILLLPYPTPLDALTLSHRTASNQHAITNTFVYPAQFWPHKNHITLLKAMRFLKDEYDVKANLLLPGSDRGNRKYIEKTALQLDINEQVQFPGFISREELLNLYLQADALVYPSTFGPGNLPPLEAFALRCPVVASAIPGAEEQMGDAAILVDPYDHEGFADAMHRVTSNAELRTSLIQRGLQRARKWTSDDVIKSIFVELDRFEVIRELWP